MKYTVLARGRPLICGGNKLEIYIQELNKRFQVKASNKNIRKTYELQLMLAQSEDIADDEPVESIKATLKLTNDVFAYVVDILKLTDKQAEKLDDLESTQVIEISNHIAMRLMGLSEEDIKKANADEAQEEEKK